MLAVNPVTKQIPTKFVTKSWDWPVTTIQVPVPKPRDLERFVLKIVAPVLSVFTMTRTPKTDSVARIVRHPIPVRVIPTKMESRSRPNVRIWETAASIVCSRVAMARPVQTVHLAKISVMAANSALLPECDWGTCGQGKRDDC